MLADEMLVHSADDAAGCICDWCNNAAVLPEVTTSDVWSHGERLWRADNRRAVVFIRPLAGVPRSGYVEIRCPKVHAPVCPANANGYAELRDERARTSSRPTPSGWLRSTELEELMFVSPHHLRPRRRLTAVARLARAARSSRGEGVDAVRHQKALANRERERKRPRGS